MNRIFPIKFRYSHPRICGLGRPHPYVEQGTAHVNILLKHRKEDTKTGKLFRASLEKS